MYFVPYKCRKHDSTSCQKSQVVKVQSHVLKLNLPENKSVESPLIPEVVEYCKVCIHVVQVVCVRWVLVVRPLPGYERGTIKSVMILNIL